MPLSDPTPSLSGVKPVPLKLTEPEEFLSPPDPEGEHLPIRRIDLVSVHKVDPSDPLPPLLSVQQTCALLNCSRTTVFKLLAQGELERRKYNRVTRVTLRSVLKLAGLTKNDVL